MIECDGVLAVIFPAGIVTPDHFALVLVSGLVLGWWVRGESWEAYVQANAVFPWLSIAIAIGPTTTTDAYAFATGSQVYFPGTGDGYWNVSHVAGTEAAVRDLVAITPADADTRYIAATSVGLFISSLTSHAWEEIAEPLAGRPIQAIDAVAHSNGYTLLATTMNGEIWTGRLAIVATQS